MLELLVAMLVTGVGVLGVTGLGALTVQQSRAAAAHADAVLLVHDLLERVRANPAGLAAGAYAAAGGSPASADCIAGACSAEQMAAFDLSAWRCALGAEVAEADCAARMNAQGGLSVDAASGALEAAIRWRVGGAVQTLTAASRG